MAFRVKLSSPLVWGGGAIRVGADDKNNGVFTKSLGSYPRDRCRLFVHISAH